MSYFEGNEERRTPDLVDALARTARVVALVTDGGMPSVSDPGYRLVRAALDGRLPVTAAPGPSAVTTALALSGLPCDRFCFEGFLPRKPGERRARLAALADRGAHPGLLRGAAPVGGHAGRPGRRVRRRPRRRRVCRELTKTYEEVRRAPLGELADWAVGGPVRGEITLVVGGRAAAAYRGRPTRRCAPRSPRAEAGGHVAAGRGRRGGGARTACPSATSTTLALAPGSA